MLARKTAHWIYFCDASPSRGFRQSPAAVASFGQPTKTKLRDTMSSAVYSCHREIYSPGVAGAVVGGAPR
jgi:hypothetical protein